MLLWLDVSKHTRFIAQNVEEGLQEKTKVRAVATLSNILEAQWAWLPGAHYSERSKFHLSRSQKGCPVQWRLAA
jgi:hypothetical protein